MCGLFGVFGPERALPSERGAAQALAMLAHRGPDARAVLFEREHGLVLGHARLSIIDLESRSDQPFKTGHVTLVFNGEIYNYRQLRQQLLELGVRLRTDGDTEVIAEGYRCWGQAVFQRLRGMFAIALHDARQSCLHLVRDDFGIKPLCYLYQGGSLAFASETKAIAALRSLSIDGGVLTDMLAWGFQMENESLYAGVRYLPPGSMQTYWLKDGRLLQEELLRLWSPESSYGVDRPATSDERLHAAIDASVEDHLIADVPVAIALSGGLDSSIVAASAARRHPGLHAFTFTVASGSDPEVEHAALLCRQFGLRHTVARMRPVDMQGWLRTVAWHLEEPVVNINALVGFGLAAVVRDHGLKVVLVGEGSDELFGGYPWYRYALAGQGADTPGEIFQAYFRRRAQASSWRMLRADARELGKTRLESHRNRFASTAATTRLDAFLAFDQATQMQYSQLLRVDRTFMAHGIEARVPFLYRPVHEASAGLRPSRKIVAANGQGRHEKIALADAFRPLLPSEITERPKFGASGTVNLWDSWLTEGLADEFDRCLQSAELRAARQMLEEFVDWTAVLGGEASAKEKFALSLLIEAVDTVLFGKSPLERSAPIAWDIV